MNIIFLNIISRRNFNLAIAAKEHYDEILLYIKLFFTMQESITISSPDQMIELWKTLWSKYHKILLYGDLGAWKTHFTKGYWLNYDINPQEIQSPTYAYLHEYHDTVLHIDMYRINSYDILFEKGIIERIDHHDYIVIERPKFEKYYADSEWLQITITKWEGSTRSIHIKQYREQQNILV